MAQNNPKSAEATERFHNQQPNDTSDRACPICFEVFNNIRCREAFTTCSHSFCQICLQKTLKIKPFCPLCRQYQGKDKYNNQDSEPIQLDENIPWNPQIVRAFYGMEEVDEEGRAMRTVRLSNGERTNIHVDRSVKINVSDANIIINGKQIQNSSDCNQQ